jgi:hypothetical protein
MNEFAMVYESTVSKTEVKAIRVGNCYIYHGGINWIIARASDCALSAFTVSDFDTVAWAKTREKAIQWVAENGKNVKPRGCTRCPFYRDGCTRNNESEA